MTQRVYEAYKQNGWPHDHFDVEKCRAELTALQDEWDRVQMVESEAKSKKKKQDYMKRLTPEQLKTIEERKKLAEQQNS